MLYTGASSVKDTKHFKDYKLWLLNAKPREQYVYFTGNSPGDSFLGQSMGKIVMDDAFEGFVYLVQKRIAPYIFDYIAIRAPLIPTQRLVPARPNNSKGGKW